MQEYTHRHKSQIKHIRKCIKDAYKIKFANEDGLHDYLNNLYNELDYHIAILQAFKHIEKYNIKLIKGKRIFKTKLKCALGGCSKCIHKSCKQ